MAITPILTRSYDNTRSGSTLNETILTPSSVKTKGIKKLFSVVLTGNARGAEAQPLLRPSVRMADGVIRDLLIVATMSNVVFAFDANTGTPIWSQRLGTPIIGSRDIDAYSINDLWGILSTPVIDPDTNIVYCVAWSSPDGTWQKGQHNLCSLDISTGAPVHAPLSLANATYNPTHGLPTMTFKSVERKQRAGLLLTSISGAKTLFIGCGSIFESLASNQGWIIAVDVKTFSISAAWTACPAESGGGIWQGAQGPAADDKGNIYFVTGNGSFDGVTDFGESIVKLAYTPASTGKSAALQVADWWTPWSDAMRTGAKIAGQFHHAVARAHRRRALAAGVAIDDHATVTNTNDWGDMDLGSAGALLIPQLNMVLGSGKDGILYACKMFDMGKTMSADLLNPNKNYGKLASPPIWFTFFPGFNVSPTPADISSLDGLFFSRTHHMHSTPVCYNSLTHGQMLFNWGENECLRAWNVDAHSNINYLARSFETASPNAPVPPGGMPGGMISLSADGPVDESAILWACVPYLDANKVISAGRLLAYDATSFAPYPGSGGERIVPLWDSQDWNIHFSHNKFNIPIVSGGKVYVPTYDGTIDVYGLAS